MSLIEKVNIASKNAPFWTESVSGDEVFYAQIDEKVVIALVDVTGHGSGAHLFAKKIKKQFIGIEDWLDPAAFLAKLHDTFLHGLGAAIGIAVVDKKENNVRFCGVGNISAYILGETDHCFSCDEGAVGLSVRKVNLQQHQLQPGDILLMHSDGIKSRLYRQYDRDVIKENINDILTYVFENYAKEHDDASCIVYRY